MPSSGGKQDGAELFWGAVLGDALLARETVVVENCALVAALDEIDESSADEVSRIVVVEEELMAQDDWLGESIGVDELDMTTFEDEVAVVYS